MGTIVGIVVILLLLGWMRYATRRKVQPIELWDDGTPKTSKPQYTEPDPPTAPNPFTQVAWSPDGAYTSISDTRFDLRSVPPKYVPSEARFSGDPSISIRDAHTCTGFIIEQQDDQIHVCDPVAFGQWLIDNA